EIDNILTAGRTISAAGDTWEVTRVIPAAALTGQAAGEVAAYIAQDNISVNEVEVNIIQKKLAEDGVKIHNT
ncbi:MAG: FAD-dependent oxidoreductase, partial [bacterium]